MLLNLSKHPSPLWPENQTCIAMEKYGPIMDLPFYHINPQAEGQELDRLEFRFFPCQIAPVPRFGNPLYLSSDMPIADICQQLAPAASGAIHGGPGLQKGNPIRPPSARWGITPRGSFLPRTVTGQYETLKGGCGISTKKPLWSKAVCWLLV